MTRSFVLLKLGEKHFVFYYRMNWIGLIWGPEHRGRFAVSASVGQGPLCHKRPVCLSPMFSSWDSGLRGPVACSRSQGSVEAGSPPVPFIKQGRPSEQQCFIQRWASSHLTDTPSQMRTCVAQPRVCWVSLPKPSTWDGLLGDGARLAVLRYVLGSPESDSAFFSAPDFEGLKEMKERERKEKPFQSLILQNKANFSFWQNQNPNLSYQETKGGKNVQ